MYVYGFVCVCLHYNAGVEVRQKSCWKPSFLLSPCDSRSHVIRLHEQKYLYLQGAFALDTSQRLNFPGVNTPLLHCITLCVNTEWQPMVKVDAIPNANTPWISCSHKGSDIFPIYNRITKKLSKVTPSIFPCTK